MRLTSHPTRPATAHRSSHRQPRGGPLAGLSPAIRHVRLRTSRSARPATHNTAAPEITPTPGGRRRGVRHRLVMIIALAALVLVLSASSAHAQTTQVLALAGSIDQVLTNIRTWVMSILASLATVFLSIGGVRYVMGGGNPGEIEKAKTAFRSAAIGYGLAALAPLVVTVLQGIVGA
ncbi:MAG: pilin [Pseudonocardiaceae bacterium]